MPKNNSKPDLLTEFFDQSKNYKTKRSRSYFKFLWLQKQQQFSEFKNPLYMTFILKPTRLAIANFSILLITFIISISFGFSMITQAQNNPNASFIPTETTDTTRLNDCNLDISFPKKIEDKSVLITSGKNFQYESGSVYLETMFFGVDATNNNSVNLTQIACLKNLNQSTKPIIKALLFDPENKTILKIDDLNLLQAKEKFKWNLFDNQDFKNIQIVKAYDIYNNNSFIREYLVFENKDLKFVIHNNSYSLTDYSFPQEKKNTLDQIPRNVNINYNEKSDFVVSKPIVYDENGNFPSVQIMLGLDYQNEVSKFNQRFLTIFFGGYLGLLIAGIILVNYLLKKNFKTKLDLQTKLRLLIGLAGLVFLVFLNVADSLLSIIPTITGQSLDSFYNPQIDIISTFLLSALSLIVVTTNWKKITSKVRLIDLVFIGIYSIYALILFFNISIIPAGAVSLLDSILQAAFKIIFTLVWIAYAIWNGFLSVKKLNSLT